VTHISAIYRRDRHNKELDEFCEKKPKTLGQQARSRKAKKAENNLAQNFSNKGV
jgi:hypothetical protein